jgi:cytochrome c-type biogenesis protein CcmH
MIWIALGISLVVVGVLAWPVLRRRQSTATRADYDITVFQDQLKEVDRDLARGVLTASEADAARLEIQRRILAAGRAPAETVTTGTNRSRLVGVGITAVAVPVIALGVYLKVGTPDPGQAQLAALEAQGSGDMSTSDIDALVDRLAARVASEPNNPEGYAILGRTYRELGRFEEAAQAFKRLTELQPNAEAYSSLGEALSAMQNGRVSEEAHAALMSALTLDRNDARARFYLGLEQAGNGNPKNAIAIWRELTASAPADAPWVDMVRQQMAAVAQDASIAPMSVDPKHPLDLLPQDAKATAQAMAAAKPAAPAPAAPTAAPGDNPEQTKMIEGMVAGLAARLEQNPEDYDGWMMLGRSYTVLRQPDKAGEAYKKAMALKPADVAPKLQYAGLLMMDVDPNAQAPLPAALNSTVADILKLQPEHPEALYLAGLGRAKTGDAAGARGFWQKAQKVTQEGSPLRNEIDRRLQLLK